MQRSGLTEIMPLICTSLSRASIPPFPIKSSLRGHRWGWRQRLGSLLVCIWSSLPSLSGLVVMADDLILCLLIRLETFFMHRRKQNLRTTNPKPPIRHCQIRQTLSQSNNILALRLCLLYENLLLSSCRWSVLITFTLALPDLNGCSNMFLKILMCLSLLFNSLEVVWVRRIFCF